MSEYYSMKIPKELADLFEEFINKNKELGYRTVSQYILNVLQDHAKELIRNKLEIKSSETDFTAFIKEWKEKNKL